MVCMLSICQKKRKDNHTTVWKLSFNGDLWRDWSEVREAITLNKMSHQSINLPPLLDVYPIHIYRHMNTRKFERAEDNSSLMFAVAHIFSDIFN